MREALDGDDLDARSGDGHHQAARKRGRTTRTRVGYLYQRQLPVHGGTVADVDDPDDQLVFLHRLHRVDHPAVRDSEAPYFGVAHQGGRAELRGVALQLGEFAEHRHGHVLGKLPHLGAGFWSADGRQMVR